MKERRARWFQMGNTPRTGESRIQDLPPPGYSNQLTPWLSLTEAGIDRKMWSVAMEYPARLLLERSQQLRVNQSPNHGASTCLSSLRR